MGREREVYYRVLEGVALGDAIGLRYEIEGKNPSSEWIRSESFLKGIEIEGYYAYSDDTELTMILAESLIENCGFNPRSFAEKLALRASIDNPLRNYGTGTAEVIVMIRKGIPWWIAARRVYNGTGNYGNGSAIRVAPIPLFYSSKQSIEAMAVAQSLVTHTHPWGVEAARLQALAIYYTMEGVEPEKLPKLLAEETLHYEYKHRLEKIPRLIDADPRSVVSAIGNGVEGFRSMPAALYIVVRTSCEPVETLLSSISLGGDVDSIASMAMAITAICSSRRAWRSLETYLVKLESREEIRRLAEKLYEASLRCREKKA